MTEDILEHKTRESEEDDDVERMVEAERELRDRITQSEVSENEEENFKLLDEIREELRNRQEEVYGKIQDIELIETNRGSDKLMFEIKHSSGSFNCSFRIPKSPEKVDKSRYPLLRLMEYNNVRRGRFLDLKGKKVPVSIKSERIVVPENPNKRISMEIFQIFQNARRTGMIEESKRVRGNRFVTTGFGNYVAGLIVAPSLFVIGHALGFLGSILLMFPFGAVISTPVTMISMMLTFTGGIGIGILCLITATFLAVNTLKFGSKAVGYLKKEYLPF